MVLFMVAALKFDFLQEFQRYRPNSLIWSFFKYLCDIFFASIKYVYNSLYLLPASFGCLLRAAERQPATFRLVKQSKSSKMINSKDKVDFLVQVKFFCNLEPFFTISKLFRFLSAKIDRKLAESASTYRGFARISPRTWNKIFPNCKKILPE